MKPDTLDKLITHERKAHPNEQPDRTVQRVWNELANRPDGLIMSEPAVRDYVQMRCRGQVLQVERKVLNTFTPGLTKLSRSAVQDLTLAELESYCDEYVSIPGVGDVLAGDVTREQWAERIDSLHAQQEDIERTIYLYDYIVTVLNGRGAKCLRELFTKRRVRKAS